MRSPRFWKVGRMFPRWSELDAFDRFHHTVYQRISSLDLVRAKPHKNTKLIFTVIIRCLVLLCWTLSHFSNTFPTKGTQLDTTTLIIWKNIDTRERDREIKGRFFFALCCYTVKQNLLFCYQVVISSTKSIFTLKKSHRFDGN